MGLFLFTKIRVIAIYKCMVVITRGEVNRFVLTLNEKATVDSPEFLMVLYDKSLRAVIKFFLTDVSTNSDYNEFVLEEGVDETIPRGEYKYKVYQKDNQDDEDIPSENYLLEVGLLISVGSANSSTTYSRTDSSVVYDS